MARFTETAQLGFEDNQGLLIHLADNFIPGVKPSVAGPGIQNHGSNQSACGPQVVSGFGSAVNHILD